MNLRQEVRKENLKRWKALGPAIIQKPLKRLREVFPDLKNAKGEFDGHHPVYAEAKHAASRGDGGRVNAMVHEHAA